MKFERAAGILLHPTSLPSPHGIGDLGPAAFAFVDRLVEAGQRLWQVLPLGPTGYGNSPYSCLSAFAGNILLISFEKLVELGLIGAEDLADPPEFPSGRVDYGLVIEWKQRVLKIANANFVARADGQLRDRFASFCERENGWLDEYALFMAIRETQGGRPWYEWPVKFKTRDERTLIIARQQLSRSIEEHKFYQFLFYSQWAELREHANGRGIKIIGDIPIFVALDSCDVWSEPRQFKLNADGSPTVVAGVPPDYFSKTGQLWGNPIYDWDAMTRDGFRWWVERFRQAFKLTDVVRVDHFRGFVAAWEVPGGDETAEKGQWVNVPGRELFSSVERALGRLPVIAEDLGVMTREVEELRDAFGFPGMRILQYAFPGDAKNRDLPHNYVPNTVVYTGTHDNDTTLGWWHSLAADSHERKHVSEYVTDENDEINWKLIRAAYASVADLAIIPMQDVLGLGSQARMNTPATSSSNWEWRMNDGAFSDSISDTLKQLAEIYGRT